MLYKRHFSLPQTDSQVCQILYLNVSTLGLFGGQNFGLKLKEFMGLFDKKKVCSRIFGCMCKAFEEHSGRKIITSEQQPPVNNFVIRGL